MAKPSITLFPDTNLFIQCQDSDLRKAGTVI